MATTRKSTSDLIRETLTYTTPLTAQELAELIGRHVSTIRKHLNALLYEAEFANSAGLATTVLCVRQGRGYAWYLYRVRTTTTIPTLSQLAELAYEASMARDWDMMRIADLAIAGNAAAIDRCAEVIAEAKMHAEEKSQ